MFACEPGMRLHVGEFGTEELLCPVATEPLDHVDMFAAAVVATAGVALGVLIGQHAAGRLHDRAARVVLAGNHLEAVLLAAHLGGNGRPNIGIGGFEVVHPQIVGRMGRSVNRRESRRISHRRGRRSSDGVME